MDSKSKKPIIVAEKDFNVTIKIEDEQIKILVNGFIHISICQRKFVCYQSWIDGNLTTKKYVIQFIYDGMQSGGDMRSEYDSCVKWKTVLGALDKAVLFPKI